MISYDLPWESLVHHLQHILVKEVTKASPDKEKSETQSSGNEFVAIFLNSLYLSALPKDLM
jgi:hypothetical protein